MNEAPYRILFTSSRVHDDPVLIGNGLDQAAAGHERILLVHGKCDPRRRRTDGTIERVNWDLAVAEPWRGPFRGGDWHAHWHAVARGWETEPHPARWTVYGNAAGGIRNSAMVRFGASVCVGAPLGTAKESPGTFGCMALARRAGIPVIDLSLPPEPEGLW